MTRPNVLSLVAAVVAAVLGVPASASAYNVYAAASLSTAFPEISGSPRYSFAGSNTLQAQIERGAPADVFASASPTEAQTLFAGGRCARPVTFATNVLVMIVPNGNPGKIRSVYSLRGGGKRVAVGTAGVPVGAYTRKLLARLRLSSVLRNNTVSQETNVNSVTAKVALGSADVGFVYRTDGRAAADRTRTIQLPRYAQPPVRYQMCAVRRDGAETRTANSFIRQVTSKAGRAVLRRYGFGLPPKG
ncbi:Molybdate-binding protein ModA [Paraconexibacter sp. AEG42_29]|uniref:Molybdate-binding protein ModA n=1 Tax=Paraconexibacter sp. AEG42_29 TaxID=2997339 RepID=A0AAU7AVK1_9ACTN